MVTIVHLSTSHHFTITTSLNISPLHHHNISHHLTTSPSQHLSPPQHHNTSTPQQHHKS
ncbi:hypothetical protein [Leyella stercorea]|uniref:hypothetical protein n=1 Tax=Leyella stercorea TaxID=363265 RepID=UPI0026726426|nr:hypothetical protein [Leyella stercorea]